MLLEFSQYLESYLWEHYKADDVIIIKYHTVTPAIFYVFWNFF